jgi:uncharacterized repeat protein (TIGR01451 family)
VNTASTTITPTNATGTALPQTPLTITNTAEVDEIPTITAVKTNNANGVGGYSKVETSQGLVTTVPFRVLITNTGTDDVTISSLIDTPYGAQCAALIGTTITGNGGTATCDFSSSVDLTNVSSRTDVFAVQVTDTTGNVGSSQDDATVTFAHPDLSVDKVLKSMTDAPGTGAGVVTIGDTLTYTIKVVNTGNTVLHDVKVADSLIPSIACARADASTFDHVVGDVLDVREIVTCTGDYVVQQLDVDTGKVLNEAMANGLSPQDEPVQGTDVETVPITQVSKLTTDKTVYLGQDAGHLCAGFDSVIGLLDAALTYCITVTNDGNVTLYDAGFDDDQLGVTGATAPAVLLSGDPSALAPGASATWYVESTITQNVLVNTATGSATNPKGDTVSSTDTATVDGRSPTSA